MAFDLNTWKQKVNERLQDWKPRMEKAGANSVYAFLAAASVWPVVEASRSGEWAAMAALGGLLASVGSNLLANMIQTWKDEAGAAASLQQAVADDPTLRAELDAVFEKLDTLKLAQQALAEEDCRWFEETLQRELAQLGSTVHYEATMTGDGAIAQGGGAKAVGAGGILVEGDLQTGGGAFVTGNVISGGDFVGRDQKKIETETYIEKQEIQQAIEKTKKGKRRILEAAINNRVVLNKSTRLFVYIRRYDSDNLLTIINIENEKVDLHEDDVQTRSFLMEFPASQDGVFKHAEIEIKVDAPEFLPPIQSRRTRIPVEGDSEVFEFLMVPQQKGVLLINIQIVQDGYQIVARSLSTNGYQDEEFDPQDDKIVLVQMPIYVMSQSNIINTKGGSIIGGDAHVGRDLIGRDQDINVDSGGVAINGAASNNVIVTGNGNIIGEMPGPDPIELRRRYLENLRKQCQALPLAAIGGEEGGDADVTLDQVYIALDTTTMINLQKSDKKADRERYRQRGQDERPVAALEAFERHPRLALLGGPGSGKSTFVRHLQAWQAAAMLGEVDTMPPSCTKDMLPVQVMLRDLVPYLCDLEVDSQPENMRKRMLAKTLCDLLRVNLTLDGLEAYSGILTKELEDGDCFLVLDGLDEVPQDQRSIVRQAAGAIISQYRPGWMVVTCRVRSYIGDAVLPAFQAYTLAPFNEDRIRQFAGAWYRTQAGLGRMNQTEVEKRAADLSQAAFGSDLRELSNNPMMLTTMAIIHQNQVGLPSERVRLYALAVDVLLRRWRRHRAEEPGLVAFLKDDLRLRAAMERLAYEAHSARSEERGAADLERGRALTILDGEDYLGDTALAAAFLDYVDQHTGLLVGRGGSLDRPVVYSFPHRTFQEYLAGSYAAGRRNPGREFSERAGEGDYWALAAQMGFEELYFNRRGANTLLDLAYRLCPVTAPDDAQTWRSVLWSGQIAALVGRAAVEGDTEDRDGGICYLDRLLPRLVDLLGDHLPAIERGAAGRALAKLNDPRNEALDVDAMRLCYVPAGKFLMGSDKKQDDQAFSDEKPQHEVDLPTYWIGQFPVTNAQYEMFVEDGGYGITRYWKEAEAADVWLWEGKVKGRNDDSPRSAPMDLDEPFNLSNHPVVGVTWYEMLAFTRWLTDRWEATGLLPHGCHVMLPSEAVWEKAARGGLEMLQTPMVRSVHALAGTGVDSLAVVDNPAPARICSWEGEFDPNRANIGETGIGSTSAVGCFTGGASPYGLLDMNGNVWEWTRSIRLDYPYKIEDGRENLESDGNEGRVLRGGAFIGSRRSARCAYRRSGTPGDRSNYIGFRVSVELLPSSSAFDR
jgi:formylglycine-generating enzyme required for sulfatase activity